ncbi:Anti-sigma-D factor RsdA to sigma factor binding region [Saccharopolyspora antimicrobica]|uniref:Anti-sigma-D factor RsdA to sigma factor binding region n=1 Tax=Saccharopolyspora antimicrobica TaxID=455193 RepID=A0A1I5DB86_9PSEU|nr:anti-sigma-D factor RsdA [Saccharopolyspora antimicrobica]RKT85177.1 anti-sigma-D factor RsdA-like protein [Saccharopolyspora antimicrobica]SFN96495.1 Anti-sigma-D factor RsdA to sigma factor binding region [Saccharopolyspora antimicrobica]
MAERKGPEGEREGRDPVESGQHEDRSTRADGRDVVPAAEPADEGTELSENRRDSDSDESENTRSDADSDGAAVLAFRSRPEDRDSADDSGELVDHDDLDEPIDLAALQDDDALLDALGGTNPDVAVPAAGERPSLEALLVAWRQDVDSSPIGDLVDVETAALAISSGARPRRWLKRRHLVPVATAAAVLMIGFTGVGVAARDAQPGDMLWGVAQVLYSDHTRAVQAASSAREDLDTAESAIERGNRPAAQAALESAQQQMRVIDDEHGLSDLQAAHASLTRRIDQGEQPSSNESTPQTTPPTSTPSPSQPSELPEPTDSSSVPPTSSTPTETTTSPSETSGSSENPSSSWGGLIPNNSSGTSHP